jgi:alpha-galactosidase/6-phospho-beta-glucosidase family protein
MEAAIARDLERAFLVFMNDPQVRALSEKDARRLFAEMTERTIPRGMGYGKLRA